MVLSIIPVGDGLTVLVPTVDAGIIQEGEMYAVEAVAAGISIMFRVVELPYSLVLPYAAAVSLSESEECSIYVYGQSEDNIIAEYACQLIVNKNLLFKALGAWEALYENKEVVGIEQEVLVI